MNAIWTARDLDLMETLCRKVRLLSVRQVAAGWWPDGGSLRIVRRRLRRLSSAGLLNRTTINAHPPLAIGQPLAAWKPGQPAPSPQGLAQRAKCRWSQSAVPQEVIYASRLAGNLFGSTAGRLPEVEHRDHDLLLGGVYVHYRLHRPKDTRAWLGEDAFPKAGYRIKDPDALLISADGVPRQVIESAGRYSAKQVQSFHEHCAEHDLPYELW